MHVFCHEMLVTVCICVLKPLKKLITDAFKVEQKEEHV